MFDWIVNLVSGSEWTYAVVLLVAGGDVLFPLLPSETLVITAAAVAAQGGLSIWLLIPATAIGAFAGDNVSYALGRSVGDRAARRLLRGERGRRRLQWAEQAVKSRGSLFVLVGRFVPGGRTASTFAAGTVRMPYRRFALADGVAALGWASYSSMLGFLGGEQFEHALWKAILLGAGIALTVTAAIEGYRRLHTRGGKEASAPNRRSRPASRTAADRELARARRRSEARPR